MGSPRATERWRPTAAHVRAVLASAVTCTIAVLAGRPDLVVIVAPLATVAVWAAARRPVTGIEVEHDLGNLVVHEGDATTLAVRTVATDPAVEDVAAAFDVPAWIDVEPVARHVAADRGGGAGELAVAVRPVRWGRYQLLPPLVVASSAWDGFRYATRRRPTPIVLHAHPRAPLFDTVPSAVHAPGLVGTNRSPRPGAGLDLALVRPFQPGDRLRRVHWAETLRSGELHVTATTADHDRHVAVVVDAFEDVGESRGHGDQASSLDVSVRAAAAIAEHYVRSGDRVGLSVLGARGLRQVRPAAGRAHLRRLLMTLSEVVPASAVRDDGRLVPGVRADALVLVLSPLTSPGSRERISRMVRRGADVVAIDCLPPDIAERPGDDTTSLAWRIERLARDGHLRRMRTAGIPVVPWRGSGSLDRVLRARQGRR